MLRIPRPIGTIRFLLAWLTPWRPAFVVQAEPSKLRFFAHHRDMLARHVAKYGHYEPDLTDWIVRHLDGRSGGIVVDVGANLGWHTIHAAVRKGVDRVVAFEPDAFNAWLLDRNLSLNGVENVIVVKSAVGSRCGVMPLYRYKPSNLGRHSLVRDYGRGMRLVPVTDVDSALEALGLGEHRVRLMKIDVEGFEPAVIAGAARTLPRTDAVLLEYSPELYRAAGLSPDAMLDTLQGAGFAPHRIETEGRPVALAPADVAAVQWQTDLLWLKRPEP
jgi:FkbM family methyltransferase